MSDNEGPKFLKRPRSSDSSAQSISRPQPKRRRAISSASTSGPATDDDALRFPRSRSRSIDRESSPSPTSLTARAGRGAMPRYLDLPEILDDLRPILDTVPVAVDRQLTVYELDSKEQEAMIANNDSPEHDVDQSGDYDPQSDPSPSPKPKRHNRRKSKKKKNQDVDPLSNLHKPPPQAGDSTLHPAGWGSNAMAAQTKQSTLGKTELIRAGMEAAKKLSVCDEDIAAVYAQMGLPLIMDRLPRDLNADGENMGFHTTSTMTQAILMAKELFDFPGPVQTEGYHSMDPALAYTELSMNQNFLEIHHPPISPRPDSPDPLLESEVTEYLQHARVCFEDKNIRLHISRDWGTEERRKDKVDVPLILPQRYQEIIRLYEEKTDPNNDGAQDSSLDALSSSTPPLPGQPAFRTPDPPRQRELSIAQRTPESPLLYISRQAPNYRSPSAECVPLVATREEDLFKDSEDIAERLIKEHKLQLTVQDAQKLDRLLKDEEPSYIRRRSHQRLCEKLGTAEQRDLDHTDNILAKPMTFPTIQYTPREAILAEDTKRRAGNTTLNEDADDPNYAAAKRILAWIEHTASRENRFKTGKGGEKCGTRLKTSEVMAEARVGELVKGSFWGHPHVIETENTREDILGCLRFFGTTPQPDYGVLLSSKDKEKWSIALQIYLLIGECKKTDLVADAEAQLAMTGVPALILIVIMHLSTRTQENQKLRAWMFIYVFTYTSDGIIIYAQYPKLVAVQDGKYKWKFVLQPVTQRYQTIFRADAKTDLRMQGMAVLFKLCSHTEFLLQQLLAWSKELPKSAVPVIDILVARARLQLKDWKGLITMVESKMAQVPTE